MGERCAGLGEASREAAVGASSTLEGSGPQRGGGVTLAMCRESNLMAWSSLSCAGMTREGRGAAMRVLLIGSGGREHALAWKLAQSPRLTKLWIAPGNAGTGLCGENVAIDVADHAAVVRFARGERGRSRRDRAGCAGGGGAGRRCARGGHPLLRAEQGGGAARGQQELHQGALRRDGDPDRGVGAVRGGGPCPRLSAGARGADRDQGRWAGAGQGRDGGDDAGRGRSRGARLLCRARSGRRAARS